MLGYNCNQNESSMSLVLGRLSSPDKELIDTSRSLIYEINVYKYDLALETQGQFIQRPY